MGRSFRALGTLWLLVLYSPAAACPRCIDATPYRHGLLLAVAFLLPIPFVLLSLLVVWLWKASKDEFPNF